MELWYWKYDLTPKRRLNARALGGAREGALIRLGDGFADVHPWPELGDAPLDEQLALLAKGDTTPLTQRSLAVAAIDGDARDRGVNLFEGLTIPDSHWPYDGGGVPRGFDTVKVKMGPDASIEPLRILAGFRLRLDFNGSVDRGGVVRFIGTLPPDVLESIDFLEDPTEYDARTWNDLRARTGLRLAIDRAVETDGVDVLVVKPAVQGLGPALATDREIVITSYMDHPIGQLSAAYFAARHAERVSRCGLLTHVLFESDPFIERMKIEEARLVPPEGTGLGFDDLLAALPWKKLE
jgi:O-succinylbenzoate synthase